MPVSDVALEKVMAGFGVFGSKIGNEGLSCLDVDVANHEVGSQRSPSTSKMGSEANGAARDENGLAGNT